MSEAGAMASGDYSQRCRELLAGEVLGDLLPQEEQELADFRQELDLRHESDALECTAVAVQLALAQQNSSAQSSLPKELRTRILKDAPMHLSVGTKHDKPSGPNVPKNYRNQRLPARVTFRIGLREVCAWLAFAAALLLCLGFWSVDSRSRSVVAMKSPFALRESLLESASTIRVKWEAGSVPLDTDVRIRGDITWNTSQQQGVMRFVDLPINDPTKEQYQLWIIDPSRDANPIDGGVFDVASEGEVFIAVDAKLEVLNPQAFAVTIEKPGGVVVSTRERLPLLAKIEKS